MSNSIEPPVLLSRLMTFVFAASLVVVIVLIVTLAKMYPLDKTQVFFLTTQPRSDLEIRLDSFTPTEENIEIYKQAFVKEYIKSRNEIIPNAGVMRQKWGSTGSVSVWSTPEIYNNFADTFMWTAYMSDVPDFDFRCPVEFTGLAPRTENKYAVSFRYFCTNSDGQMTKKDYTIVIGLKFENTIKWTERLNNPLGLRVSEYAIESGEGDPLNTYWFSN